MTTCSNFCGICFSTSTLSRRSRNGRSTWKEREAVYRSTLGVTSFMGESTENPNPPGNHGTYTLKCNSLTDVAQQESSTNQRKDLLLLLKGFACTLEVRWLQQQRNGKKTSTFRGNISRIPFTHCLGRFFSVQGTFSENV